MPEEKPFTAAMQMNFGLSPKQTKAMHEVLSAKSIAAGIKNAKISSSTWYEWMKDEKFKTEFIRQQTQLIKGAWDDLKSLCSEAVEVLGTLLHDEAANIRLRSAMCILERVAEIAKMEDLAARVDRLEELFSKNGSVRNTSFSFGGGK